MVTRRYYRAQPKENTVDTVPAAALLPLAIPTHPRVPPIPGDGLVGPDLDLPGVAANLAVLHQAAFHVGLQEGFPSDRRFYTTKIEKSRKHSGPSRAGGA
jgi:hypothetical protein